MIKRTILSIFAVLFVFSGSFAQDDGKFRRGGGMMVFTGYGPMKEHPVNLYYYIPTQGNIKKMRVLVSMHGAERSGRIQRGVWRNLAEEYGFIVLAPEFKHDNGYLENGYQFGWVSEDPKIFRLRPREVWTYRLIEAIFDYFKEKTGNVSETYDMFGHSAGGQFVHRYLWPCLKRVWDVPWRPNPGNYTYPDERGLFTPSGEPADPPGWPYSVKDTPFASDDYLAPFFKRDPDHPDRHRGHRARQPRYGREQSQPHSGPSPLRAGMEVLQRLARHRSQKGAGVQLDHSGGARRRAQQRPDGLRTGKRAQLAHRERRAGLQPQGCDGRGAYSLIFER